MLIMYSTKKYSQAWTNKSHAIKRATYMYEGKENIASNDLCIPIKKLDFLLVISVNPLKFPHSLDSIFSKIYWHRNVTKRMKHPA